MQKADQRSAISHSLRTLMPCGLHLPPEMNQKKPRSVPTLWRTADVRGWPSVDSTLGVLGQGVLPCPVKVVHLVLHEAADLLVLKATGVICREGHGVPLFRPPPGAALLLQEGIQHR